MRGRFNQPQIALIPRNPRLCSPAVTTQTVYLQLVIEHLEPELLRRLVLKRLDLRIVKFDRLPTLHTDHVIVMFVVVEVFISRDSIREVDFACKAAVAQQLHRSIYRRVTDAGVLFSYHPIDVLYASVPFVGQKAFENEFAMRCEFELASLQILHENLHLWSKDFHGPG